MPRLSLRKLVVVFLPREGKAIPMDMLARVSVLEGITGVKPVHRLGEAVSDHSAPEDVVQVRETDDLAVFVVT